MYRLLLAALSLALTPTFSAAAGRCHSVEPELIVLADVQATMSVVQHPETCSLVVSILDTSPAEHPIAFVIGHSAQAAYGEVSVRSGLLRYRRTVPGAEREILLLELLRTDGHVYDATLVIRMQT